MAWPTYNFEPQKKGWEISYDSRQMPMLKKFEKIFRKFGFKGQIKLEGERGRADLLKLYLYYVEDDEEVGYNFTVGKGEDKAKFNEDFTKGVVDAFERVYTDVVEGNYSYLKEVNATLIIIKQNISLSV